GLSHARNRAPAREPRPERRRDPRGDGVEHLPLHGLSVDPRGGEGGGRGVTHVGRSVRRVEDARLLTGAGRFVDDVDRPGQLWMRVVRSPSAHATLVAVDTEAARAVPGVRAVVTVAD